MDFPFGLILWLTKLKYIFTRYITGHKYNIRRYSLREEKVTGINLCPVKAGHLCPDFFELIHIWLIQGQEYPLDNEEMFFAF